MVASASHAWTLRFAFLGAPSSVWEGGAFSELFLLGSLLIATAAIAIYILNI
jgi:hypothetical protein